MSGDPKWTAREFRDALTKVDLSQSGFAQLLAELGDPAKDIVRRVQRWAAGEREVPGPAIALLNLLLLLKKRRRFTARTISGLKATTERRRDKSSAR